jgi:poly(3-hydroxyalkanoate) synthetase
MLRIGRYKPYRRLADVRCPVLVCVCENDDTTPPEPAMAATERAPNAELVRYRIRHFEVYVGKASNG